jgi:CheY-like chemotaxis protein
MRILIVEDEYIIALHLEMMLGELGYEICGPATSLAEAKRMVAELKPDLVTVDIRLADGESGIEVARHLQQAGIPFIVVSATLDERTLARLKPHAPLDVVPKPINPPAIRQAVARAKATSTH